VALTFYAVFANELGLLVWVVLPHIRRQQHIVLQNPDQQKLVETLRTQMTQMKPPALPLLDLFR
jgi:hypothetical protein